MAFTSGELLDMPKGVIGLIRKRSFLLLQSFAGAAGTGLKSFNMVATGTWKRQENKMSNKAGDRTRGKGTVRANW